MERATRDLIKIKRTVGQLAADDCCAAVLELDHRSK
jgi:hypothetical protein